MKKITGLLAVLFLMISFTAGAARPEYYSDVSGSTWLQVQDHTIDVTDEEGLLLKVQRPVFSSRDSAHGRLIASLKKESDQIAEFFEKDIRETKELAARGNRDVRNGRWLVYMELSRDDDRVLSLLENSFHRDLAGERYGYRGMNYDAKTGKKLRCLDVFAITKEELADMLVDRLKTAYGRNVLGDNPKRTILARIDDDADMEFLPWVLTADGVDFYFRKADFAGYSADLIPVTISFREEPKLFNLKYTLTY